MRRNGLASLAFIVLVTGAALTATFVSGNSPLLGLDLQGGVSVVLQPTEDVAEEDLGQAIEIMRRRVDALGVAEPEIARQGDAIVVQLPGVDDRERALELVGQTAELRFRPVLQSVPPSLEDLPDGVTPTTAGEGGGDTTPTTAPPATTGTTAGGDGGGEEQGLAPAEAASGLAEGEHAAGVLARQGDTTTTTGDPGATTSTTAAADPGATTSTTAPDPQSFEPTPLEEIEPDETVVLDTRGGERLRLGPTALTGEALSDAQATLQTTQGAWAVDVTFRADGIDGFNQIAATCFNRQPACPTGRLGIVIDGIVESAPVIQRQSFARDEVQITGSFTEGEAKDLALVLSYGALPVELEQQQSQTVSASLGQDALDAGVTAGLVGLAIVALYMLSYYRLLGVVAILSLAVSAGLLWSIISYLGESRGLALTLAGVTGIIVSIGVAVDSNVVFYEHLKEEVWKGRTLRSAVDGSFASAFSTIVKADVASLIGAGLLYWLTVGPVRGFAFYLFLSTLIDLVSSYFFMRPLTVMLAKSPRITGRHRLFGLPRAQEAVAPA